jgi:CDP-diacylglycerol--serine O-phosphatidyltransferase
MNPGAVRRGLRRGVYVIPTSLTILNLFFGFRSIVMSTRGIEAVAHGNTYAAAHFFQIACYSLFFAALFDTFDGLVARAMNATSEFGKEYDSIADVVTFGAAPAVLVYAWGLHILGGLGGAIAFLYLVGGSLRLARFNINYAPNPIADERFAYVMLVVTAFLAFAMVSTVRYRSQKYANLQRERSLMYFVGLALVVGLFSKWPREFCFVLAVCYVSSGPLIRLWSIAFPSRRPIDPAAPATASPPDDLVVTPPV